jgi:quinol-cytochrome oxidoreductase complex cytochrome b subunit
MSDSRARRQLVRALYPVHWSFLLSQVALWSLLLLTVTGVHLALFYRPGTDPVLYDGRADLYVGAELPRSFATTLRLSADVIAGEVARRVHRAATYVFVASLLAHLARVLLTGAFRGPRRLNYPLGGALLLVGIGTAYTGHLLPYDMVAGATLQIAFTLVSSIPLVGDQLAAVIFGGASAAAPAVIVRAWVVHVFLLPVVLVAGVALHLLLVARQGHTRMPGHVHRRPVVVHDPLPRSLLLGLLTTGILLASATLVPWSAVRLAGPFRSGDAMNNLEASWYMFWTQGAMRIFPAIEIEVGPVVLTNPFVAGVVLPGVMVLVALAYPWLEPLWRRDDHSDDVLQHPLADPVRVGLVSGWFAVLAVLSLGPVDTVIAGLLQVPVSGVVVVLRVALVVLPLAVGVLTWWYARRRQSRAAPERAPAPHNSPRAVADRSP